MTKAHIVLHRDKEEERKGFALRMREQKRNEKVFAIHITIVDRVFLSLLVALIRLDAFVPVKKNTKKSFDRSNHRENETFLSNQISFYQLS